MTSARPPGCSRPRWRAVTVRPEREAAERAAASRGPARLGRAPVADSVAATSYTRLRWAWPVVASRAVWPRRDRERRADALLPGTSAASKLWWVLPALLRSGDSSLTGGSTWDELLAEALTSAAGRPAPPGHLHTAALAHPLTRALAPEAAGHLEPTARVPAATTTPSGPPVATPKPAWPPSTAPWPATSSTSATGTTRPGSSSAARPETRPARTTPDQHQAWSRCELIPMRYNWDAITAAGPLVLNLDPAAGGQAQP